MTRRLRRHLPSLLFTALLVLPVSSAPASTVVRNTSPEVARSATNEHWPVAYPRTGRGIEGAPTESPEHLLHRFVNLHTALRYDDAHAVARALVAAAPEHPIAHYNHACVLARLHRPTQAVRALGRAVEHGWRNDAHAIIDPDLEILREHPEFEAVVARMRRLALEERIAPGPIRLDEVDRVVGDLDTHVPALLERYRVPGVSVALVRDGACVWTGAYGHADDRAGSPMTDDAVFRVASPVHLLSLIALARLDAGERLDFTEVLIQAEGLAHRFNGRDRGRRVRTTSRSRGITGRMTPVRQWRAPMAGTPWPGVAGTTGSTADGPLGRWPGVREQTAVVDLLRAAVELASRERFEGYCRDHLLAPLEMSETWVASDRHHDRPARRAVHHGPLGSPLVIDDESRRAGRRVDTTAGDLARLLAAMIEAEAGRAPDVLPGDTANRIIGVAEMELARLGLGVRSTTTSFGPRVDVADVTDGAGCLMRWYPTERCGVVVLFNAEAGTDAALRIAAMALGGE
ncbi:MAG: serine hydrolase domain-containing protein [Planctomycetota bacterium]|jgi:CubicO group peptidase (beta-lactamase class C family)